MIITYKKIALYYLLLSFFANPISAIFKGQSLILFGDILLMVLVIDILFNRTFNRNLTWIIILITLALAGMLLAFRYGFNINIIGLFLKSRAMFVFMMTIFFYVFTFSHLDNYKLIKIDYFIEKIIQLNIVVILLEGVAINFFGMQNQFFNVFNSAGYRILPNPVFFDYIPNGLVFGAQHASIISVIGLLWWFPWNEWRKSGLWQMTWLVASAVSWSLSVTTTSILCFIIPLLFASYSGLAKKRRLILVIFSTTLVFLTMSFYQHFFMMRYESSILRHKSVEAYMERLYDIFTQPISAIKRHQFETLIGSGQLVDEKSLQYSPLLSGVKYGDFGILTVAIRFGAILISILLLSFFMHIFSVVRFVRKSISSEVEENIILRSVCVTLAVVVSLVHYTSMLTPGIMQLFAAAIALPYVVRKKGENKRQELNDVKEATRKSLNLHSGLAVNAVTVNRII